jgi:hypothetical protein
MIKSKILSNFAAKVMVGVIFGAAISGCQSIWDTSPDFGSSVNDAVAAQLVNPNAPAGNQRVTTGLDGGAAKGAVDNYQKSFEVKTPTSTGTYPTGVTLGTSGGSR